MAIAAIRGDRTIAQIAEHFDVQPSQVMMWKVQLEGGAADVFGAGRAPQREPAVDVKQRHAEVGELTLENNLLYGALTKAGLPSAR